MKTRPTIFVDQSNDRPHVPSSELFGDTKRSHYARHGAYRSARNAGFRAFEHFARSSWSVGAAASEDEEPA